MGALCVLRLGQGADESYRPLLPLKPFAPFRDASCGQSTYHLTVLDCMRGLQRARDARLLNFADPPEEEEVARPHRLDMPFDCGAYEYYERVENGDLNWVVPGKLIAFSGPHARRAQWSGYQSLAPEDYWAPFKSFGVTAIIRLNKRLYDRRRFTEGGFRHHDLFFPDGACPTPAIVDRFCALVEAEPGCVAVHCKAGLGRTGVLIGLYLQKHFGFSANEALGYLRITRPGSVIGPQQHFLRDWERRMWAAGSAFRAAPLSGRTPRRSMPRISHGGGGAYDDGDISDEDAHAGGSDEEGYDDGGYTCGVAGSTAAPPPLAAADGQAAAATAAVPVASVKPAPPCTSPAKPMHSGTRPSSRPAPSVAPARGAVTMSRAASLATPASTAAARAASGEEDNSHRLRRGASLRDGYVTDAVGALSSLSLRAQQAQPGAASATSALRRSGSGTTGMTSPAGVPRANSTGLAPMGMADRLGAMRRSMLASLPGGGGRVGTPPSAPGSPLTQSAEARTSVTDRRSSIGDSPLGGTSGVRLVTASGQPRKLPPSALAGGAYANAYRAASPITPSPGDPGKDRT